MIRTLRQQSWSWLLRNLVLPLGDRLFGQQMIKRLRFLEKAQWWGPEQVRDYRNQLLNQVWTVAYHEVPFYRGLMDAARVPPEAIRTPADLSRLPLVTKDMLRAGYPHRTTRATGQKTYDACTSGSTGKNFCVREDAETAGWYRASFLLSLEWSGWRIGEPHVQSGMTFERSLDRRIKDYLLRCHYVSAARLDDAHLDANLAVLEKYRIGHLWGYPGSLYHLALRARETGWNRPLQAVVTWGDMLFPHYRETIEEAFQARVYDTYGCAEGIQVSAQCGCGDTYHVHDLDVVVEYVDDEGQPVPDGQPGNLILTRLHAGPMPLLRYRVGDRGISGSPTPCACGRGFGTMSGIQGRDTDVVVTPSGNRLIVHFFTGVLEHFQEIDAFQIVQETVESIVLRIVPTPSYTPQTTPDIVAAIRKKGAEDLQVDVELVSDLPLTSGGKRRFVISKVAGRPKADSFS